MSSFKSMTAYGRAARSFAFGSFVIEIQSVNRRHLEINVSLPQLLTRFEMEVRKMIATKVKRGMVNVIVRWHADAKSMINVIPNLSLAKGIKRAWEQIAYDLGLESKIDLPLLAAYEKELLHFEENLEEKPFQEALTVGLKEALNHLVLMKEKEGAHLHEDFSKRRAELETIINKIEKRAPVLSEKLQQKLTERVESFFTNNEQSQERIFREVAYFDVTEEIVRFKSHLKQLKELTQGKTIDFLLQELNREINTIGSKASIDVTTTQYVIEAKAELEKMREQVQNIE